MSSNPGIPAIVPHLNTSGTAASAPQPAFTADDAKAFAQKMPPGHLTPLAPYTVVSVQFMTAGAAPAHYEVSSSIASNTLLCVVEVHGRFQVPSPGLPQGVAPAQPIVYETVYEFFDGRTGNFLGLVTNDLARLTEQSRLPEVPS